MSTLAVTTVTSANNTTDLTLRSANTNAGAIIVSANGTGITIQSNSTTNAMIINSTAWYIGGVQLNNTVVRQSFTGNGSTTTFTVTGGYTPNNLDVYQNGIKISSPDVTISSGTNVVFAVAPPNGALIEVVGQVAGTINYSTVNTQASYTWTNTHTFSNDVTINANLTITGTTVTVNTQTLDVKDANITVAKGAGGGSAANGAGIQVDSTAANFYWSSSANSWTSNVGLNVLNGKVGIGITNPSFLLDVNGNIRSYNTTNIYTGFLDAAGASSPTTFFGIDYDITNNRGRLDCLSGGVAWRDIDINSRGGNTLLARGGGSVGIGTTSPSTYGKFASIVSSGSGNGGPASSITNSGVAIGGSATSGSLALGIDATGSFYSWIQSTTTANATYPLALNPNGGNVGIGTTSPATALEVKAAGYSTITVSSNTAVAGNSRSFIDFYGKDSSNNTLEAVVGWFGDSGVNALDIRNVGSYPIRFAVNNSEIARFDTSGNLGIGVSPSAWSVFKAIQISGGGVLVGRPSDVTQLNVGANYYFDGTSNKYIGTGASTIFAQQGGEHQWWTASSGTAGSNVNFTQVMTLGNSGNLLVGITSNPANDRIVISQPTQNQWATRFRANNYATITVLSSSVGIASYFVTTVTGTETYAGQISVSGASTSFSSASDYRLKENFVPIQNGLDKILNLNPVTFKWKIDGNDGIGFVAHELQKYAPECVVGEKDAVKENGEPDYQSVDPAKLVPTLVKAIQELKAENDALRARVEKLETK